MKDFRVEEAKAIRMIAILCVLLAILSLVGCKKDAVRVDISKLCSPENEKKYVTTSGYLDDKGSIFCSNIGGGRMDCMLDVTADVGGAKVCGADTEEGSGANQIENCPADTSVKTSRSTTTAGTSSGSPTRLRSAGK